MRALLIASSLIALAAGPAAAQIAVKEGTLIFSPACSEDGKQCLLVVEGRKFPLLSFASTASDKRAAEKASLVPTGETRDCIRLTEIREARVRDDSTIDYELGNRQIWRNTLPLACSGLGFEQRYLFKSSMAEICSIDTITVLQAFGSGMVNGPTCGLGKFERVQKKTG